MIERRHEFATMAALGATPAQHRLVRLERGCARPCRRAAARGRPRASLLALMLIAMLQHVFDPPPDHLAIPWAYLGELAGAAIVATTLAVAVTASRLRRLPLGRLLREQ